MSGLIKQSLLFILALAARIPFLFAGYGVEEDSWGHVMVTAIVQETGIYEVSRLPGHPLYEGLLLVLWHVHSPFLYNLPSALAGAAAVVVFYRLATFHKLNFPFFWSLAFCFVPVFFVSSTYTIDYSIALFFSLLAYEQALHNQPEAAGVWLAVATGFRITALGMLLPIALVLFGQKAVSVSYAIRLRNAFKFALIALLIGAFIFLPVYLHYGISFFDFHRPPYPGFAEIIYKATIGVWGIIGFSTLLIIIVYLIINRKRLITTEYKNIWLLVLAIYTIAYLRMPEKAAFFIPTTPFVLLYLGIQLPKKWSYFAIISVGLSGWLLGLHTAGAQTGTPPTKLAIALNIAGQQLHFDPLRGIIPGDLAKRKSKEVVCLNIAEKLKYISKPTVVIAGWWFAQLSVYQRDKIWNNKNVVLVYYESPAVLKRFVQRGYQLRYLPEQQMINDIKFKTQYTAKNATLLPLD